MCLPKKRDISYIIFSINLLGRRYQKNIGKILSLFEFDGFFKILSQIADNISFKFFVILLLMQNIGLAIKKVKVNI